MTTQSKAVPVEPHETIQEDQSFRNMYQWTEEQKKSPSFCEAYANAEVVMEISSIGQVVIYTSIFQWADGTFHTTGDDTLLYPPSSKTKRKIEAEFIEEYQETHAPITERSPR